SRHFLLDHVNDTQVTKPARIIGARRTELLSSHTHDILRFWYLLALRGHTGLATTRVEADYKRLKTLISQRNEGQ
ncbi:TPA: hypothetical protein HNO47_27110, partial [Escherichia coli]|nr:hypothetical protein [Escherichia coli]